MKKIMALVLAAMLLLGCCSFAAAEDVPEGYPAIIEGLNFDGAEVYIYDWYSTGTRSENPTEEEQLTYDYRDWLEATYNCKIIETALSDWTNQPAELQNFVMNQNPDNKLAIIGIGGGFAGPAVNNDLPEPRQQAGDHRYRRRFRGPGREQRSVYGVDLRPGQWPV